MSSTTVSPTPGASPGSTTSLASATGAVTVIACSLLAQHLSNFTLIVVDSQPSVTKMWEEVVTEYTYKGNGDVCVFLNKLHACHAELDAMGVSINDDNYQSTII
ncbi:hypothetical protein AN958_10799 [Leucoagaricus sp. SymC.cos]|nr:hypothetical protein AN958_10799 [Leucoagaricus sp. SymC.cos]